eukprot:scaffold208429_cov30-Tisochrysis_lutea.AAC.1
MGAFGKATRCRIVAERHRSCSPYVTKMARGASTPLARSTVGFVPSPKQTMVPEPRSATSTGAYSKLGLAVGKETVNICGRQRCVRKARDVELEVELAQSLETPRVLHITRCAKSNRTMGQKKFKAGV